MNNRDLYRALGEIDDDILERSEGVMNKQKNGWLEWGAVAACLCLVILGAVMWERSALPQANTDGIIFSEDGATIPQKKVTLSGSGSQTPSLAAPSLNVDIAAKRGVEHLLKVGGTPAVAGLRVSAAYVNHDGGGVPAISQQLGMFSDIKSKLACDMWRLTNFVWEKWGCSLNACTEWYRLAAFSGLLYNIYTEWAQRNCEETPEQLADIIEHICGAGFWPKRAGSR